MKCTSTGRGCEWFADQENSRSSSPRPSPNKTSAEPQKKSILPLPVYPFATQEQSRSFHYFRRRTVNELCGWFSADFWGYVLLQATHHNKTLRHAVLALGSLHEHFEATNTAIIASRRPTIQSEFALKEYTKAIGSLVRPNRPDVQCQTDVYLTACLLFACFEVCDHTSMK
jgi:transcription factor-like protein